MKGLFRVVSFLIIISDRIAFPSALIWHPNKWNEIFDFWIISSSYHVFNEYEQNLFRKNFWIMLYGIQFWALKNDCLIYTTKQTCLSRLIFHLATLFRILFSSYLTISEKNNIEVFASTQKTFFMKNTEKIYATLLERNESDFPAALGAFTV